MADERTPEQALRDGQIYGFCPTCKTARAEKKVEHMTVTISLICPQCEAGGLDEASKARAYFLAVLLPAMHEAETKVETMTLTDADMLEVGRRLVSIGSLALDKVVRPLEEVVHA